MKWRRLRSAALAGLIILGGSVGAALAETDPPGTDRGRLAITVFRGHGADTNLREIPGNVIEGKIVWEDAWFTGVHVAYALDKVPAFRLYPFSMRVENLGIELEGQLTKHCGLQSNYETHAAVGLRTPDLNPIWDLGINFALFDGISYSMGRPSYEDGPGSTRTGPRFRLQNYIGIEAAVGLLRWPAFQLAARIHHRSGVYGLFAPDGVGSNFFSYGARWRF